MIGVDEVGRGCLAGPLLVVAARASTDLPSGLVDSKVLNRNQREGFFKLLVEVCTFGEGWVSSKEIDARGLTAAMRLGVSRALRNLQADINDKIIMDGPFNYIPKKFSKVICLINADASVPLVSAASIYAKVRRDSYMRHLKNKYPGYGFEYHVGYGTPGHISALRKFGAITNLHRRSFQPLRQISLEL